MPKYDSSSVGPSWTFTLWLAFQEKRRDTVGNLTRIVANDPVWPGWRTIEGLEQYSREQGFSPALIAALQQAAFRRVGGISNSNS